MTRFLMPLRDSVELVKFAFQNSRQGDLFIRKAAAATIVDLVQAVKNVLRVPDHPYEIIGWRHGEKLYETLASAQELGTAEDMTGLNYKKYFSEGDDQTINLEEFNSHNTRRMEVAEIEDLLLSLPEFTAHAFSQN
jgi:UDP-glucose 4-epimerase